VLNVNDKVKMRGLLKGSRSSAEVGSVKEKMNPASEEQG
jgi:hypothetical protein